MRFLHFRLLLWKSFHLKRYHWFISILEFVLPIGSIILLLRFVPPSGKAALDRIESQPWTYTDKLSDEPMEICYSPSSSMANTFMNRLKTDKSLIIKPLSDEKELELYISNSGRPDLVGIHFRNLGSGTSFPNKFSYILRQLLTDNLYNDYVTKAQFLLNENFIEYIKPGNPGKMLEQLDVQSSPRIVRKTKIEVTLPFLIVIVVTTMLSVSLMQDILEEKNSGIKELMKITGVKELTIWLTWFLYAISGILISITICTILMLIYPLNNLGQCLLNNVPFVVLWLFFILFCVANISFCFMITSIFQNNAVVTIVFSLYNLMIAFGYTFAAKYVPLYLFCVFPTLSFFLGFSEIETIENNDINFTWSVFTNTQNKEFSLPFGLLYIFCVLIVDTVLHLFLAFYITSINPGKFGTRKSPFFLCQGIFSRKADNENVFVSSPKIETDPRYFESPPSNLEPAIQIVDLHKRFGSFHVVRGVNLVTFKGEITALLGHNGAGKTTTMSILTGLISPSSGYIYYNGMNVFENMDEFRLRTGLCPQENRTFPYLSVMNHLLFFGQLKGATKQQATEEANEYLEMVGMKSKEKSKVNQLSGGMTRKLCLCVAMMGKAEILILDEPSSGMDTESRRSLWNLLLQLREGRSMILTTHYMEEADALGDRIAIMNHGIIVCHGTSMFLKKAYETGYELTITKSTNNSGAITQVVQSALPSASVVSDTGQEVVYKLPLTETHRFPLLFRSLESAVMRLGIRNIGVTATTMEQVFLIAGGATAYDPKSPKTIINDADYDKRTGLGLFFQQLLTMFKKKSLFTRRDLTNLFMRLVLPTVLACLLLFATNTPYKSAVEPVDLSLSTAPAGSLVLYDEVNNPSFSLEAQLRKYVTANKGIFRKGNGSGLDTAIMSLATENLGNYLKNFVFGIEVNNTGRRRLMYSSCTHCKPIAIDAYSNALLRTKTNSDKYSIETTNQPVLDLHPRYIGLGCSSFEYTLIQYGIWLMSLAFFTVDLLTYFAHFVSMERTDGFYHIQMMSRMSPFVYWLGTMLFDFIFFSIAMILRIALFKTLNSMDIIGLHEGFYVYLLITTLFAISGLLFIYILTFLIGLKDRSSSFFLIFNIIFVVIMFVDKMASRLLLEEMPLLAKLIEVLICIAPFLTYYKMFDYLISIFLNNSMCFYCIESYKAICEAQMEPRRLRYFEFPSWGRNYGMLTLLLQISGQIVVYSLILFLMYSGIFDRLFNTIKKSIFGAKSNREDTGDDDVQQERNQVQKLKNLMSTSKESQKISLLVDGLRKNYHPWFRKFTAVSDVSIMVDRGTCFGLLGVNGAGKSTTFKMLTAEIIPTFGDAQIDGYKLSKNKSKYLKLAGYCSQTNCFIEQLTGSEMLTIIASMRGVRGRDRNELVNKWLSIIGLEEYKNRRCGTYSGGNKRKLCSVMSLIGDPQVVFLDEPTSGVDPVSRRNLYDVMAQSRSSGQTVILTSHSMEECETLCDRLTIMVSGVMKCIGSVQHLKKRYAQGFSASVKIFDTPEAQERTSDLKQTILQIFNPSRITLKDERAGSLYYQITDTSLQWSVLFEMMESIKSQYQDVVQDYVITDTSLEEVFISFAKDQ